MKFLKLHFLLVTTSALFAQQNTCSVMSRLGPLTTDPTIDLPVGTASLYGKFNTFYGYRTGAVALTATDPSTIGWENTYIGANAGSTTLGEKNTFIGYNAGAFSVGQHNVYIGRASGINNNDGIGNTMIGTDAGASSGVTLTGSDNLYAGKSAGYLSNGSQNVFLGMEAGFSTSTFQTGSRNVYIGFRAGKNTIGDDQLRIHNALTSPGSPALIEGSFALRTLNFNGNVTINGNSNNTSGLTFTDLKSTAPAVTGTSTRFLTVNTTGEVVFSNLPLASGGLDTSIYLNDGTLQSDRTVTMDGKRMIFNTGTGTTGGIYIGNNSPLFDNVTFPTNTGNYKLYVDGGILTEKVKVALRNGTPNNWADYVFAADYKLMPLHEVESYVRENKHLPGVSSSEELAKEGLDLGDMQAKQMEKIEELTLYVIEQNKTLEKQNKEIEELQIQVKLLLQQNK